MSALTDFFTSLANKVRSKLGTNTTYTPAQAVAAIDNVYTKGVTDTQKGNATVADVVSGKTFTSNSAGVNQTGTFASQTKSTSSAVTSSAPDITPDSGKWLSKVTITPIKANGTAAVDAAYDTTSPYIRIPYGWWPLYNTTYNCATVRLTAAQAQACHEHTGTYNFPDNSTGATVDIGAKHSYRYINPAAVYNEGRYQIDFDGQKTYSGSEATPAVTYTCGSRGMYLVLAYSTSGYMSAPSITRSGTGTTSSTTYYIDANPNNSSQAKLVIRAVLNCASGTTLTVAANSNRSRLTFIRIR